MKKAALVFLIGLTAAACGTQQAVDEEPPRAVAAPLPTDPRLSEMQVLMTELLDRIEVMNARLQRLENQGGGAVAATPARDASQSQSAPRHQQSAQAQPQQRRPPTGGSSAEQYRAALEMFGKGRLDDSRALFQQVFDADPSGDLADNALYWIAETHFTMGRYTEALNYYQRIITDFSDQNKAPDAMLKSGLAHAKLGDLALARRTFEQLIARYPYSSPAAAAKYEMKRIQY